MKMFRLSGRLVVCAFLFVFLASVVQAQDFRGRVQGRVTDTSDAVIQGATITLSNVSTGVKTVKQTNEAGLYRFDSVDPGPYTVAVEAAGFSRLLQENVSIQAQADITVNAVLKPGGVQETVTVEASPVAVEFNSSSVKTTVDQKLAEDVPRLDRNPFKLSLLNPAVLETRRNEMNPFQSLSANSLDLGGGTSLKNDLLVDGSPISMGTKASYTPNSDSIQEVNVQQNSVDAEAGHSAGGVVSMTTKSGTNEFHGTVFYTGRNPKMNAVSDRTTNTFIASRYHIWGGAVGNPIIKSKLFNFFSYEQWIWLNPQTILRTVPTALERTGDFSKSLNANGGLRTIYDPYTTVLDASGKVTRTPFAGNILPANRIDALSRSMIGGLPAPNNAGDNVTGVNNVKTQQTQNWRYLNYSERADYYATDKMRVYGRVSRYRTTQDMIAPYLQSFPAYSPHGTARNTFAVAGNAIYTINATTVFDIRAEHHTMVDDWSYPKYQLEQDGWSKYWPNNPWYKSYAQPGMPVINPGIFLPANTNNFYGDNNYTMWYTHLNGQSAAGKISQQRGSHFLKVGFDIRRTGGGSTTTPISSFAFTPAMTADTYLNPNTKLVGNEFASFLLGTLDANSTMITSPIGYVNMMLYSGFVQDDWKVSTRVTLNLGLRYEYETPWHDSANNMSRYLDLTQPIPEMQQNVPQMPAAATALRKAAPIYNGAWVFADSKHPGVWNGQKTVFMPRVGLAFRVNDKTALRFGFARYVIPTDMLTGVIAPTGSAVATTLAPPYPGFSARQTPIDQLVGIPQATFSNPFPSNSPLIAPIGKGYGRYYGLGDANLTYTNQDYKRGVNDRLNVTFSRQLPSQILAEVTYFANFGRNLAYAYNQNLMDPQLGYTNKTALDAAVSNPFYQYLTADKFPGSLRNQKTVSLKTLLTAYPQYGNLFNAWMSDRHERYNSVSVKVQRPFQKGYNFLIGYNYNNERDDQFFDDVATYNKQFTMTPSVNARHRGSVASTYQLPFGKGRAHLNNAGPAVNAILGGWQVVGTWYFSSGNYLRFAQMLASGDPHVDNPTPQKWFDTSVFKVLPAYTPRTNPWQYPDVKGPIYWEIQSNVSKSFAITERIRMDFKLSAFNLTNRLNRADPDLVVTSSTFGQAIRQSGNTNGRQIEYGLKIVF